MGHSEPSSVSQFASSPARTKGTIKGAVKKAEAEATVGSLAPEMTALETTRGNSLKELEGRLSLWHAWAWLGRGSWTGWKSPLLRPVLCENRAGARSDGGVSFVVVLLFFVSPCSGLCKMSPTDGIYVRAISEAESTRTRRSLVLSLLLLLSVTLTVGVAFCGGQQRRGLAGGNDLV